MNTTFGAKRLVAAFTMLAALAAHADDQTSKPLKVEGPAAVIDANHLRIKGHLIRLAGMQAPSNEWCEGCGDRAKEVLEEFVKETKVWCQQATIERRPLEVQGAALSHCQLRGRGEPVLHMARFSRRSVSWHMVNEGWGYAFAWLDFFGSLGRQLAADGELAKAAGKGMWAGEVNIPDHAYARTDNRSWMPSSERTITGDTEVLDGETLRVGGVEVQLAGVAALDDRWCVAERNRGCGTDGLSRLRESVAGKVLRCEPTRPPSTDSGNIEAFCTVMEDLDEDQCDNKQCWINWQVIERGDALTRRSWMDHPPQERHVMATTLGRAEQRALIRKRGIWSDTVDFDRIEADVEHRFGPLPDASNIVTGRARKVRYNNKAVTMEVDGVAMDLYGVVVPSDAWCKGPGNYRCTTKSMRAAKKKLSKAEVTCTWMPSMNVAARQGRHKFAICQDADGTQINKALIAEGSMLAFVYPGWIVANARRATHEWVGLHIRAREEKIGIWRGTVEVPRGYQVD